MEKEIRALQAEVAALKSQIGKSEGGKEKKVVNIIKTEIEEEYPTKIVMETDPDQDVRIIEILKLLDEENAMKQKLVADELERKREAEAKFVASEKAKADVVKQAKAAAAEADKVRADREAEEKVIAAKAATAKVDDTKVKASAAATKIEDTKVNKGSDVSKAKVEGPKKVPTKKTSKSSAETQLDAKKKTSTKSATKKTSKLATTSNADDWALLAESTLKRKSIAQLTDYLIGRVSPYQFYPSLLFTVYTNFCLCGCHPGRFCR